MLEQIVVIQLNPISSTFLVILYFVASILLIGLIGAAAYLLFRLNTALEAYQSKIEPLLTKADALLSLATEKMDSIGSKTETILAESEATTEAVQRRVESTAELVQQTVNRPLIGVNALVAGIARGAGAFLALQRDPSALRSPSRRLKAKIVGNGATPERVKGYYTEPTIASAKNTVEPVPVIVTGEFATIASEPRVEEQN